MISPKIQCLLHSISTEEPTLHSEYLVNQAQPVRWQFKARANLASLYHSEHAFTFSSPGRPHDEMVLLLEMMPKSFFKLKKNVISCNFMQIKLELG